MERGNRGKACIEKMREDGIDVLEVGEENQLFLDDGHIVAETKGIDLVIGRPRKYGGNPVVRPDRAWEAAFSYTSVILDEEEDLFKMYYWIRYDDGHPMTGYAVSEDGLHWEKPILDIEEHEGSTQNNICFYSHSPPERRAQTNHVFKDYNDPDPAKRYKMVLDKVDFRGRGIAFAFSPNGLEWEPMDYNVLHGGFDTQNVVLWDDQRGVFRAYLRLWLYGKRHVRMAESRDLYHWSKPIWVHGPDEEDPPNLHIYTPGAVKYSEAPNVYIMLNSVYDHSNGKVWAQLSLSRDGVNWRRNREPFLPCGEEGSWDCGMIFPAPAVLVKGDNIYIYYRGESRLHVQARDGQRSGVGCALLRKDGFIGLQAGCREGVVVTRPMAFSRGGGEIPTRSRLYLNIKADAGRALVELCDLNSRPTPGFSRVDCDPIEEDSTSKKVTWRGNPVLDRLLGVPIVMKVFLRDATIYSMRFQRTGDASDPTERKLSQLEAKYKAAAMGEEREKVKGEMQDFLKELTAAT